MLLTLMLNYTTYNIIICKVGILDLFIQSTLLDKMNRALIIDNEVPICKLLICALSRKGIDADMATNGFDGLRKFSQEHFDIVITDMLMPGLDGNGIAREIRKSNKPNTPIIGISGTSWLLEETEFDVVFEKPMSIHTLVDAVKNLIATSPRAAA
jgi:DNA-binding response OmpR family regulator